MKHKPTFLQVLFTDGSNIYWDYSKVLTAFAFGVFLAISLYDYIHRGTAFDPMNWATAVMLLIGGGGTVSKIKDFTSTPTGTTSSTITMADDLPKPPKE